MLPDGSTRPKTAAMQAAGTIKVAGSKIATEEIEERDHLQKLRMVLTSAAHSKPNRYGFFESQPSPNHHTRDQIVSLHIRILLVTRRN
jgi:hypothetical protein